MLRVRLARALLAGVLIFALGAPVALAGGIEVEPVLLEVRAPAAATSVTLHLSDKAPANIQVRVQRWVQVDGVETLAGTDDVVASPPAAKVQPGKDYTIRIVRVKKRPVAGEESYRLIIDQLPNLASGDAQAVRLMVRQSIPVFFQDDALAAAKVEWSMVEQKGRRFIVATNRGERRMRIASLRLSDGAGHSLSLGDGLIGYVLGQSTMAWELPSGAKGLGRSGKVKVTAQSDLGPIAGTATWRGGN